MSLWVLLHRRADVRSPPILGTHHAPAPTLVPSHHRQTPLKMPRAGFPPEMLHEDEFISCSLVIATAIKTEP